MSLANKEYFWLDIVSPSIGLDRVNKAGLSIIILDMKRLLSLTKVFSHIIDFRSRFTAIHSEGVAAVAETLAKFAGFSERECQMMRIAGYLHDLGKLAVPTEILEKPSRLTEDEFNIIRSHTYHTFRVLEPIRGFEIINTWASLHHERMDGSGYPFHYDRYSLPLGSRIMAVADVFTAIIEDRPYRRGMNGREALKVLQGMARNLALDPDIVKLVEYHFDEINFVQKSIEKDLLSEYHKVVTL